MIRYLHRMDLVEVNDLPADLSILDYLRDQCGITAVKEGCASGDCGACTVALGRINPDGQLNYQSINACICPAAELHGADLVTAADLETDQGLHPLQKTFIEQHASQCGFCTPGFIVSGFALLETVNNPSITDIRQAVAGNLCRCTGYGPIIDAVKVTANGYCSSVNAERVVALLKEIDPLIGEASLAMPLSLNHLGLLLARDPNIELIAGGTDLMLEVTQKLKAKSRMISLTRLVELQQIETSGRRVSIGAGVSYSHMMDWARGAMPAFAKLLLHIGSDQIRNRGTLGGNLGTASPIGDLAPVLLALDAQIILWSPAQKRSLSLNEYFLGYRKTELKKGEIIHSVEFDLPLETDLFVIEKVSKRIEDDISAVCFAVVGQVEAGIIRHLSLGIGGVAAIPVSVPDLAGSLIGQAVNSITKPDLETLVKRSVTPLDDLRASAAYRIHCLTALLYEALHSMESSDES